MTTRGLISTCEQSLHEGSRLADSRRGDVDRIRHALRLEGSKPDDRIDVLLDDLLGSLCRDLLDLDAAFLRAHHDDARALAVDDEGEIILLLDVRASLDEEASDLLARRARLMRDERFAEELLRVGRDLVDRLCDLDAACLATAAGVDLRLDDDDGRSERLRVRHGFLYREGRLALWDVYAIGAQDFLALVLMDVHGLAPLFI